ncbi:T9SS type A sorting domain-containing protein [Flavobacterium sp.]|uniref:fibronectin type III domain-containing protein n=1 Tax=Flavobacterium sp. TaxID=239 RepID=UPI003340DE98
MKKITFWLFALFTCWHITAQTTVTIGAGTLSASGTNGTPIYRSSASSSFNFSQSVQLLTAADLAAAGITAGSTITKLAFYKNDTNTLATGRSATLNLFMKNSTASSLVTTDNFTTWTTGSTNVFTNTSIQPAFFPTTAGWVEFTFTTPFVYSGGSIETAVDWSVNTGTGSASTGSFAWMYTTVTNAQAVGTSNSVAITGALSASQTRIYNTQLTFTNSPCTGTPAPGNTTVSPSVICFGSSATLGLQNPTLGSGVTYQWYLNGTAISGATSSNYVVSSVSSTGSYYCNVTCSGVTTASTALSIGPSILNAPLLEPYNTFLPNCWLNMFGGDLTTGPTATTGSGWVVGGLANSATTGAIRNNIFTTGANDWIVSPVINIPVSGYELKFDAAAVQFFATTAPTTPWESDDSIEVLVSTGGGLTNWTSLFTYNNSNQPGITATPNILDLDAYAGQNVRFAFRAIEGTTDGGADIDFSIDNFQIRLTPTCIEPLNIVYANIASTTADISWDATNPVPSVGYEYVVSTSNTAPTAAGTATTSSFASITGLLPNTTYYIFVRANCGSSQFSPWTGPASFTTACAPVTTFPVLEPFNTFLPSACWIKGDNGSLTAGPATFGTSNWFAAGLGNNGTTGAVKYNLFVASANDWIISPQFTIPATGYELKFDAAAANYGVTTAVTNWEADDFVEVLVSSTGTTNWTPLYTYNNTNVPAPAGVPNIIDLDAYAGQTVRFAYRAVEGTADGAADIDFSFDNFEIRLSPACPQPTNLVVSGVTATGAATSWDAMSGAASGYEYVISTSATPPTGAGTAITTTFVALTGLTPQTTYYLYVRANCGSGSFSVWSVQTFTTQCAPVTTLPWTEGFESVTTPAIPPCWFEENGDYATSDSTLDNTPKSGTKYLRDSWSATNEYMWTPGFQLTAGTSYDFSSWIQGDGGIGWVVDYFVNSSQVSTGATQLGGTYNVPGTGTLAIQPYANITRTFVPTTSGVYYFAFRVNQPNFAPNYVAFDDVELKLSPSCPTPNASVSGIIHNAANISWSAVPSAALGYEYVLNTVATSPTGSGTAINGITYAASALTPLTTYYFHIRSVCATGTFSTWSTVTFTTLATPPVNDNCATATVLTPGATFATNPLVGTNIGSTASAGAPAPGCASYSGGDVWYSVVVPASGSITFDSASVTGSPISDSGMAVYSGPCSTLVLVECDDDDSANGSFSMISLTNRTPGEVLYVRFWEYGNNAFGTFQVSAYDASLSAASFDTSNFVAYPNPVKDVLNLSYKTAISNVKVINLLGQEVVNANANTNDVQVNMSALNAGVYIVNVTVDDTVHSIKVIKE